MKLIDCFMYFDEDVVLDMRLNILNKIVDKFVIVESKKDHAGNSKKLNFEFNKFNKFKDKIKYLVVEDLPFKKKLFSYSWRNKDSWLRENFQRNYLFEGFKEDDDNDLVMISDIDEIPNPEKVDKFDKNKKYACFIQKNFQTKINLINSSRPYWEGTRICVKKYLKSPQWLKNIKLKRKSFWKIYKPNIPQIIKDGGWHFSFLKEPVDISKKIKSYAHQEYNIKKFNDINSIENKIKNKQDILGRDFYYKKIEIDDSYPEFIRENKKLLKKWID